MRTPEPEPSVPPRLAGADDSAAGFPDFVHQPVVPAEAAMLVPVEPTPTALGSPGRPPQLPDAEALLRSGRAVASSAAQTAASMASGAAQTAASVASGAAQTAASVASGAAQTARTAAYRGTRPIVNFGAGIGYFFRGAGRFLGSPTLWLYAVVPLVLLAAVLFGIAHTVEVGVAAVFDWFTGSWPGWIHDTLGEILLWGVRIGLHFVLGYLVLPLSIVLGAPCYVLLARRLERRLGPIEPSADAFAETGANRRGPALWRASGVAIRQAVLATLVVQFGWLLLVPLLLVPGLNVFVALGAVAVLNGFLVGLLMLAIPLHHHGTSTFRGQLRAVWSHRASVIGFGATSGLLLGVPITPLRAVVAPMVFTGAVLLHRRMRRVDAAALGPVTPAPLPAPRPEPPALPPG